MGNYIWAGSQKVAKIKELVATEAGGQRGRAGMAIVGDRIVHISCGRKSVFCERCWARGCI